MTKLARLMELFPDHVFSKPEFTALPPCLFGGADFALIPSRDEPFGLVAVEFGRKAALGVGSRLGGLGLAWLGKWDMIQGIFTHLLIVSSVVPCRVYLNGTHVVSIREDDQEGPQVHHEGASVAPRSFGRSTFPRCRVAPAD